MHPTCNECACSGGYEKPHGVIRRLNNKCQSTLLESCAEIVEITQDIVLSSMQKCIGPYIDHIENVERRVDAICDVVASSTVCLQDMSKDFTQQMKNMNMKNDIRFKCLCEFIFEHVGNKESNEGTSLKLGDSTSYSCADMDFEDCICRNKNMGLDGESCISSEHCEGSTRTGLQGAAENMKKYCCCKCPSDEYSLRKSLKSDNHMNKSLYEQKLLKSNNKHLRKAKSQKCVTVDLAKNSTTICGSNSSNKLKVKPRKNVTLLCGYSKNNKSYVNPVSEKNSKSICDCAKNTKLNRTKIQSEKYAAKNSSKDSPRCCCSENEKSNKTQIPKGTSQKYVTDDCTEDTTSRCYCSGNEKSNKTQIPKGTSQKYVTEDCTEDTTSICYCTENVKADETQIPKGTSQKYVPDDCTEDTTSICYCTENVKADETQIPKRTSQKYVPDDCTEDTTSICYCTENVKADETQIPKRTSQKYVTEDSNKTQMPERKTEEYAAKSSTAIMTEDSEPKPFCGCTVCMCSRGGPKYPTNVNVENCSCLEHKNTNKKIEGSVDVTKKDSQLRITAGTIENDYNSYVNSNSIDCPESRREIENISTEEHGLEKIRTSSVGSHDHRRRSLRSSKFVFYCQRRQDGPVTKRQITRAIRKQGPPAKKQDISTSQFEKLCCLISYFYIIFFICVIFLFLVLFFHFYK